MRELLIGFVVLLWCVPAWAEVTVIYRRSDRLVAGIVQSPHSVEVEIDNITKSELGGVPEDYATTTVSDAQWATKGDQHIEVKEEGRVVFVPDPEQETKKARRKAAKRKFQAIGLTEDELDTLFDD